MYTSECRGYGNHQYPLPAYIRELEGMGELIDIAVQANESTGYDRRNRSSVQGSKKFTGTQSLDEAIDLARYGWPEGHQRLANELDKLQVEELSGESLHPEIQWGETGVFPDVGRYLEGEPENMIDFVFPPDPPGKIIDLTANVGYAHTVPTEDIITRGAAIVAAIQKLQLHGFSVGLTATCASLAESKNFIVEYHVPLVRPGEYLDMDAAAFALVHPSFQRRLIFATKEAEPAAIRKDIRAYRDGGYGHSINATHPTQTESAHVMIAKSDALKGGIQSAQGILNKVAAAAIARMPD